MSVNPETVALLETDMRDPPVKPTAAAAPASRPVANVIEAAPSTIVSPRTANVGTATPAALPANPVSMQSVAAHASTVSLQLVALANGTDAAPDTANASKGLSNATDGAKGGTNDTNATKPKNRTNASDTNGVDAAKVDEEAASSGCAVKEDARAKAWFAETSAAGTPCVFGVDGDVRDEGSHCIFDNGDYGSNGWCYTSKDRSSWGSCNDQCPLYGPSKQLGTKIDNMGQMVDKVVDALDGTQKDNATNSTAKATENTKEEAPATDAPKAPAGPAPPKDSKPATDEAKETQAPVTTSKKPE